MRDSGVRKGWRIATACTLAIGLLTLASAETETLRRVLVIGDSIMNLLARSIERAAAGDKALSVATFTSLGSGLARLDLFDWPGRIEALIREHRPDTLVLMMGANDRQPMQVDGRILQPDTPEWDEEYARRVARIFELAEAGGVRHVVWLELPDMREPAVQAHAERVNAIVRAEAARRAGAEFFETRPILSRKPGVYSAYIVQANGMPLEVRSRDGIHLNRSGADLLAEQLLSRLKMPRAAPSVP